MRLQVLIGISRPRDGCITCIYPPGAALILLRNLLVSMMFRILVMSESDPAVFSYKKQSESGTYSQDLSSLSFGQAVS